MVRMLINFTQPLPPGTATFYSDALDGNVGKTVPVDIEAGGRIDALITAAGVADDGRSYTLTLEMPDGTVPAASEFGTWTAPEEGT